MAGAPIGYNYTDTMNIKQEFHDPALGKKFVPNWTFLFLFNWNCILKKLGVQNVIILYCLVVQIC